MVEFAIPPLNEEMIALIPRQRHMIDQYMSQEKVISYALSEDRSQLWAVFKANSEEELEQMIETLPMTSFMEYEYHALMFNNMLQIIPALSLN